MKNLTPMQEAYIKQMEEERRQKLEENKELINNFISYCSNKGVQLTHENFEYIQTVGIIAKYPNLLYRLNPCLEKDDEELISFKQLNKYYQKKPFQEGYLYTKDYSAMVTPFFRRDFQIQNHFAPMFISLFWGIEDKDIEHYIALDSDHIQIDPNRPAYMERDTWYGAPFNKNIAEIPNGNSKLKPPIIEDDFILELFFQSVYSLDIKWSESNGIKTFQAEEVKSEQNRILFDGNEYFPVRYIHAEYDINNGYFRHFDGAIHLYTKEEYLQRKDSDLNFNEKLRQHLKAKSFKLFKMNGKISKKIWEQYVCQFLFKNPLIVEYFTGKYPKHIQDVLEKISN